MTKKSNRNADTAQKPKKSFNTILSAFNRHWL